MVDLPKKKIGIVACSGEELPEGTVTRLAALKVLEQLRPNETVTICLPLFLAGGEGDRAFARFYPTIAVDGCELGCAAKATERYSNKPAAAINVRDVIKENKLSQPEGRRRLNTSGLQAVDLTAEKITLDIDELLGKNWDRKSGELIPIDENEYPLPIIETEPEIATCACGSGIPVQIVIIANKMVTIIGLPLIFQQFYEAGKTPTEANVDELMDTIKVYNPISDAERADYREGIRRAYSDYWFKGKNK